MQLKTKTFTILKIALNFKSVEAFQMKNPALYSIKAMFYLLSYPYLRYSLELNILLRYDLHYIKLNKKQGKFWFEYHITTFPCICPWTFVACFTSSSSASCTLPLVEICILFRVDLPFRGIHHLCRTFLHNNRTASIHLHPLVPLTIPSCKEG